ncbi:MAG: hypothetical protein ACLRS8_13170 [Parabacteroides merdae]
MTYAEEATLKDYIMTKDQYGDWCMPPESQELIHSKRSCPQDGRRYSQHDCLL